MLLGCIFFFPLLFFLLVECSFRAATYSISIAYSFFFSFPFFPTFLFLFFWVCSIGAARLYKAYSFFFLFFFPPFLFFLLGVFIQGCYK